VVEDIVVNHWSFVIPDSEKEAHESREMRRGVFVLPRLAFHVSCHFVRLVGDRILRALQAGSADLGLKRGT